MRRWSQATPDQGPLAVPVVAGHPDRMSLRRNSLLALITASALVPALSATAVGKGGNDVRKAGTCTGSSSSKIKLGPEDGRIEVEFEVDQNRSGVRWKVALRRNGTRFASTHRTTRGRSGSFEIRRTGTDGAGANRITARATGPSGEVCTAAATIG